MPKVIFFLLGLNITFMQLELGHKLQSLDEYRIVCVYIYIYIYGKLQFTHL